MVKKSVSFSDTDTVQTYHLTPVERFDKMICSLTIKRFRKIYVKEKRAAMTKREFLIKAKAKLNLKARVKKLNEQIYKRK
jgi:hypothetical protein